MEREQNGSDRGRNVISKISWRLTRLEEERESASARLTGSLEQLFVSLFYTFVFSFFQSNFQS